MQRWLYIQLGRSQSSIQSMQRYTKKIKHKECLSNQILPRSTQGRNNALNLSSNITHQVLNLILSEKTPFDPDTKSDRVRTSIRTNVNVDICIRNVRCVQSRHRSRRLIHDGQRLRREEVGGNTNAKGLKQLAFHAVGLRLGFLHPEQIDPSVE